MQLWGGNLHHFGGGGGGIKAYYKSPPSLSAPAMTKFTVPSCGCFQEQCSASSLLHCTYCSPKTFQFCSNITMNYSQKSVELASESICIRFDLKTHSIVFTGTYARLMFAGLCPILLQSLAHLIGNKSLLDSIGLTSKQRCLESKGEPAEVRAF